MSGDLIILLYTYYITEVSGFRLGEITLTGNIFNGHRLRVSSLYQCHRGKSQAAVRRSPGVRVVH